MSIARSEWLGTDGKRLRFEFLGIRAGITCAPTVTEIKVDRPFYYQIVEDKTNTILLAGVVRDPNAWRFANTVLFNIPLVLHLSVVVSTWSLLTALCFTFMFQFVYEYYVWAACFHFLFPRHSISLAQQRCTSGDPAHRNATVE